MKSSRASTIGIARHGPLYRHAVQFRRHHRRTAALCRRPVLRTPRCHRSRSPDLRQCRLHDAVASTIGAGPALLPEDLEHSRLILIWGTNTVATNVHLWGGAIARARKRGAQVVVIDPMRTPTAAHADWHVQLKPATDAALALGMMHVIVRDDLHDADYIARHHTVGFEALCERLKDYPPARVADITGLARRRHRKARAPLRRHAAGGAAPDGRHGALLQRQSRLSRGRLSAGPDRRMARSRRRHQPFHGDLFYEALDYRAVLRAGIPPAPARTVHLAQLGRVLTDSDMAPPITWMLVYNLNPVVTLPNQNRIIEGLHARGLVHRRARAVHDRHRALCRHRAAGHHPVRTMGVDGSWGQTYLAINPPAIAPLRRSDRQQRIVPAPVAALGYSEDYLHVGDEQRIRQLLASGHAYLDGISFDSLMERGWAKLRSPDDWRPRAQGGFTTTSGKCEFYSATLAAAGHDPLPNYVPIAGYGGPGDRRPALAPGVGQDQPLSQLRLRQSAPCRHAQTSA
jgi:anaerobic selenocysteine-containing dehydrogenase